MTRQLLKLAGLILLTVVVGVLLGPLFWLAPVGLAVIYLSPSVGGFKITDIGAEERKALRAFRKEMKKR